MGIFPGMQKRAFSLEERIAIPGVGEKWGSQSGIR
jgi:hypothetical protein